MSTQEDETMTLSEEAKALQAQIANLKKHPQLSPDEAEFLAELEADLIDVEDEMAVLSGAFLAFNPTERGV